MNFNSENLHKAKMEGIELEAALEAHRRAAGEREERGESSLMDDAVAMQGARSWRDTSVWGARSWRHTSVWGARSWRDPSVSGAHVCLGHTHLCLMRTAWLVLPT
jgi:hypothetical protein